MYYSGSKFFMAIIWNTSMV